jgi:hypothetical protein
MGTFLISPLCSEKHITSTILNIIHCTVFYLKHDGLQTGFPLRLQMKPSGGNVVS